MTRSLRRIVVGVDGSEHARRALEWALDEARLHGATVEAVHVVHAATAGSTRESTATDAAPVLVDDELLRAAADLLDDQVARLRAEVRDRGAPDPLAGAPLTPVVEAGRPAEVLERRAADADLLVVGSRGHGGFTGLLLGAVGLHAVTHSTRPVAVVPNARRGEGRTPGDLLAGGRPTRRVVAGVDDRGSSRSAVELAAAAAAARGGVLELVCAYHELSALYSPYMALGTDRGAHRTYVDRVRREADARLEAEARTALRAGAPAVDCRAVPGPPAAALLDAARTADLLVVGSTGRTEIAGAVLGSVGQQCVTHAPCPVIVMPPRARAEAHGRAMSATV